MFVRKTSSFQGSAREIQHFPGGQLANFYRNLYNLSCSRGWRSGPPGFIRIRTCFFFKTFFTYLRIFTLCKTTLHGYIKSARDKSHDTCIWRLELSKVKNTTFLVKRKFLFLRTVEDVLMKLTYAHLRKQCTHNLRYIVRTLLMKLAPGLFIIW